jgi:hypothetical protein
MSFTGLERHIQSLIPKNVKTTPIVASAINNLVFSFMNFLPHSFMQTTTSLDSIPYSPSTRKDKANQRKNAAPTGSVFNESQKQYTGQAISFMSILLRNDLCLTWM